MVNALLVLMPFLATMIASLASRDGKNAWLGYLGCAAAVATLGLAVFAQSVTVPWFTVFDLEMQLSFLIDNLSRLMAVIVSGIGAFVFLYSAGYFEKGERLRRYYFLLSLFAFSMLGVVLSGNLFQLFFCWELVGVSSFLLIGFWHEKDGAIDAARKAFLTIIVGDAFFLFGVLLLRLNYGTFDIPAILASLHPDPLTLIAGIGLIGGAISKSAQFPLHGWLADAMAGPTPVSAFLHSATMVKAGLFVIARFLPLFFAVGLAKWLSLIAAITIIISACIALVEDDIKRVLAYSTMNQLAFILLALSIGSVTAGMYHLLTHSIFKALLFFIAGVCIHATGTQDLHRMRIKNGPLAIIAFIAVASLAGIVPLAGYFSKESIFDALLGQGSMTLTVLFGAAIVLSAMYIFRWYFLIFHPKGERAHANWQMFTPLPILAILTLAGGAFTGVFFSWWGSHPPHLFSPLTLLSTFLAAIGFSLAFFVRRPLAEPFLLFFRERFLMDKVYGAAAGFVVMLSRLAFWFDEIWVNRIVRGIAGTFLLFGRMFRRFESGKVGSYLAWFVVGFVAIVAIVGVFG